MSTKSRTPSKKQKTGPNTYASLEPEQPSLENQIETLRKQIALYKQHISNTESEIKQSLLASKATEPEQCDRDLDPLSAYPYLYHSTCGFFADPFKTNKTSQSTVTQTIIDNCFCPLEMEEWKDWSQMVDQTWENELKRLEKKAGAVFPAKSHIDFLFEGFKNSSFNDSPCQYAIKHLVYKKVELPASEVVKKIHFNSVDFGHSYDVPKKIRDSVAKAYKLVNLDTKLKPVEKLVENLKGFPSSPVDEHVLETKWGIPEPGGCFTTHNKMILVSTYCLEHELTKSKFENFNTVCNIFKSRKIPIGLFFSQRKKPFNDELLVDFSDITNIIIQLYSHMCKYGVQYGYATSGCGFLFLHVLKSDRSKLYYSFVNDIKRPPSLTTPELDIDSDNGQLKTSPLVALISVLSRAYDDLKLLVPNHNYLRDLKLVFQWKYELNPRNRFLTYHQDEICNESDVTDKEPTTTEEEDEEEEEEEEEERESSLFSNEIHPYLRSRTQTDSTTLLITTGPSDDSEIQFLEPLEAYCTQRCLIGLHDKSYKLDEKCPNYLLHKSHNGGNEEHHLYTAKTIKALFREQLVKGIGGFKKVEEMHGSTFEMYKVTLYPVGYTLLAKTAKLTKIFELKLEHKAYKILSCYQGNMIPVHIGYLDLRDETEYSIMLKYYNVGIFDMILLAYGGEPCETTMDPQKIDFYKRLFELSGFKKLEISQKDILWNKEIDDYMMINFDEGKCTKKVIDWRTNLRV